MRLVNSAPNLVELRGRNAVGAPLWVGVALLLGPAPLSLFGPAPFTPLHVVAVVVLLALGVGLVAFAWPRARWVRLRTEPRTLSTSESAERPLGHDLKVRLVGVPIRGSSGNALYGIVLEEETRAPTPLITSVDPGQALADLSLLKTNIPLKVVGGWGLPSEAPWVDLPAPPTDNHPPPWDDRPGRRALAITLLVGTLVIGFTFVFEFRTRLALGDATTSLALGIPLLGIGLLLGVTLALATHGARLRLGSHLTCDRRIFGFTYARSTVDKGAIQRAYLVSPSGHHARHLLVDTPTGPLAFPCDAAVGAKMVSDLATGAGR